MLATKNGFTLIELLIVVAIISILAAIAVPNYLTAQVRAKIAKVQGDMENVAVAMEAYRADNNDYPPGLGGAFFRELAPLTTPVAYMTVIPLDPFKPWDVCPHDTDHDKGWPGAWGIAHSGCFPPGDPRLNDGGGYDMIRFDPKNAFDRYGSGMYWFLMSIGPDHDEEEVYFPSALTPAYRKQLKHDTYDITNGIRSSGDIYRFGPGDPREYNN